jgi:HEPN domain-containing protein
MGRSKGKLLLARQPLPEGGYWEDLCYMAQQSAELAVKAVYVHKGWRFAFVHDLANLLDGLEEQEMDIPDCVREAEKLTIYATQMRYPGMSGFVTQDDYAQILAIAEEVVTWADGVIHS